jgi:molecular chaperone GrpE (heat shock protein)
MSDTPERRELAELRAELAELRSEIARLDADLDESRRLNLRAAELLDIVYETLGKPQGPS